MDALESPKHEHERSTDSDAVKVREYGKLVLFMSKHSKIFLAVCGAAYGLFQTVQTIKAEMIQVKSDVAQVRADVVYVKVEIASMNTKIEKFDDKLDRAVRRSERNTYGSAK